MKLFFTLALTAIFGLQLNAQDAQSKAILDKLSVKAKTYSTIHAVFTSVLENKQADLKMEQNGDIKIKGDQFVLDLGDFNISTDGVTTWTYAKEDEEVYVDNNADLEDEGSMKPSEIFTIWESGFKHQYGGKVKVLGSDCDMIKLFPNDPEARNFHTILLYVNGSLDIKRIKVLGKGGDNYTYDIKKMEPNVTITDNAFKFQPSQHPGVEMIDNR